MNENIDKVRLEKDDGGHQLVSRPFNTRAIDLHAQELALRHHLRPTENDASLLLDTAERIFPRSPEIIGRAVQNCHPRKSVISSNAIIQAFKDKTRDSADSGSSGAGLCAESATFRSMIPAGGYKGVIEVSQEISKLEPSKASTACSTYKAHGSCRGQAQSSPWA